LALFSRRRPHGAKVKEGQVARRCVGGVGLAEGRATKAILFLIPLAPWYGNLILCRSQFLRIPATAAARVPLQ
jgi:hypothetical protein